MAFFDNVPADYQPDNGLKLTACVLADIFNGVITTWDDDAILEIQDGDFDHHSAVPRERDFRLRNGDLLQQACVYNSTERTSTTRFGMSTETEMCIAYIDYSVPRNASNLIRKQRAMWNGPLAPGVAVSSAVGPTPPAAGYRR